MPHPRARKVGRVLASLVGLLSVLSFVLQLLAIRFGIYVPFLRGVTAWAYAQWDTLSWRTPTEVVAGLVALAALIAVVILKRKKPSAPPPSPSPRKSPDRLLDDLRAYEREWDKDSKPTPTTTQTPTATALPSRPKSENGDLPPDRLAAVINRGYARHGRAAKTARALFSLLALYVMYWSIVNLNLLVHYLTLALYWFLIYILLHQRYPAVMVGLYATMAFAVGIIYGFPYRMARKLLVMEHGNIRKLLGRVIFIRGSDSNGNPPHSWVYAMWYLMRAILGRGPAHPHELPIGDVGYLKGRQILVPVTAPGGKTEYVKARKRFRYSIVYEDLTDGWIARRIHPRLLYTDGDIETRAFQHVITEAGMNVRRIPVIDGVPAHRELSADLLLFHERPLEPYIVSAASRLETGAAFVERGVQSDAHLSKEQVKRFAFPSPELLDKMTGREWKGKKPEEAEPASDPEETDAA